jgi:hypothetical protein
MWDRVCEVLTDFEFLQAKVGALPVVGHRHGR